jgi:hypothetical protein
MKSVTRVVDALSVIDPFDQIRTDEICKKIENGEIYINGQKANENSVCYNGDVISHSFGETIWNTEYFVLGKVGV